MMDIIRMTLGEWEMVVSAIELAVKEEGHGEFDYILFKTKRVRDRVRAVSEMEKK